MKRSIAAALIVSVLAACTTTSPDVVHRYDAQRMTTVYDGVVLSTRPVVVDGSQSGFGAGSGAVVGGLTGSTLGNSGREGAIGAVLGAVVGGMVGNAVERAGTREDAIEILVQLKNGERRAIVQARGNEQLNPGDSVLLVTTGNRVRVTRAPVPVGPGTAAGSNPG